MLAMMLDHDDDAWDRWQWRLRELLRSEQDPLLREALYRRAEQCIRADDGADADYRAVHLRQFQMAYLLTAQRGAAALS